ncbi:MAG: F0F1 ATP synthase subunit B [Alphaproteobacteria bacterium]|nr:F0F1 ATP synthase subunit B [Alphaproteobacteria bacterium]
MFNPQGAEFWVLISFLMFFGILFYYGVPKLITGALDERAEKIRTELDDARRLREEAQQLLADYQRKAREADDEAQTIIEQAKREAEALASETRKATAESLERRTRLAEEKISRAETQAIADVRRTAVDAAIQAAETVLKGKLAGAGGNKLLDEALRDLKGKLN